jgi:hypothetical protein
MKIIHLAAVAAAALVLSAGAAHANNHEYRPQPGVNLGGNSAKVPPGIPPECMKETTRADIVDCIKDKKREQGKADVMRGKGRK